MSWENALVAWSDTPCVRVVWVLQGVTVGRRLELREIRVVMEDTNVWDVQPIVEEISNCGALQS
jgi:hypothetical protein